MRILVVLTVALSSLAVPTDPAPAGAAGPARCTQDWRPAASPTYLTPAGAPTDPPQPLAAPPAPTYAPYHLFCDGHYITTLWRAPVNSVFESVRLAHEIIAHAVYPSVRLGVNPARGLTGLPSWFWAEPDAAPLLLVHGNGPDLVITGRYWYEELFDALPSSTRTITLRHDVVEIRSLLHAQ